MSKIRTKRLEFKPFEYQWAYDYWFSQQNAHWMHTEISLQKDVKDWKENLTPQDKSVIGNILLGFAQTETAVEDYWSTYVPTWFPIPEIKMMAVTFGAFETIHANAYAYLNDTLGLDDFKAFTQNEETMQRLEQLINIPIESSEQDIAKSLALFSGFAEGVSLFSQFAILLSFRKKNLLTGISQQMIFSCRDESLHSEAGCRLFREYMNQHPYLWNDELRAEIYLAAATFLVKELDYINFIFSQGDLETITKKDLIDFVVDRMNRKINELGFVGYSFGEDTNPNNPIAEWFYPMISGEQQTDFFANRETGYSKPNIDWNNEDLF